MPNELQMEVKFTSADLQDLIDAGAADIDISCTYTRDTQTGEWVTTVVATGYTVSKSNIGSKTGCPKPC